MLKVNDIVKVHFYGTDKKEIKTNIFDKIFKVYEKNGKLGIDYNTERRISTCKGEIFCPFETFASSVIFENIETGEKYRFSNINNKIERIA